MKAQYFNGKQFIPIESPIDWDDPNCQAATCREQLRYFGYSSYPFFTVGLIDDFPLVEVFEWSLTHEAVLEYKYYIGLYFGDRGDDIFCKDQIEVLYFLNLFAPTFEVYIKNAQWNEAIADEMD